MIAISTWQALRSVSSRGHLASQALASWTQDMYASTTRVGAAVVAVAWQQLPRVLSAPSAHSSLVWWVARRSWSTTMNESRSLIAPRSTTR